MAPNIFWVNGKKKPILVYANYIYMAWPKIFSGCIIQGF